MSFVCALLNINISALLLLLLLLSLCACRYGFHLAEGVVGRGRGSRSLLRQALMIPNTKHNKSRFYQEQPAKLAGNAPTAASRAVPAATLTAASAAASAADAAAKGAGAVRAVVHDASYWACLQLEGQQQQLVQLLMRLRYIGWAVLGFCWGTAGYCCIVM